MHIRLTHALLPVSAVAVIALAATGGTETPPAESQEDTVTLQVPAGVAARMAQAVNQKKKNQDDLPKFEDVAEGYEEVISTTDGKPSLYTIWQRKKDQQVLAELPRNFESQDLFLAYTVAGGVMTAGVQSGDMYVKWKQFDKKLALIEPNVEVRTTGDLESKKGTERVFTDRVILSVPIVAQGKKGGPVIDMDDLLVKNAQKFFGFRAAGADASLATIDKAKAFPKNVELAFELPLSGGRFGTLHYSISVIPESTGYKPRLADNRVGYFTTSYRDIGDPSVETPWVRYVNRWHLEKADPKLHLSPPKEPIVFYLEHTLPVRYRRWVRDGVLEWNKAFEAVGILNAIEVYQQDARTGAHMEKDPEDARYNFVLWTNANMGFAIGPSRVNPRTGQILDADIVMDEGFMSSWVRGWQLILPLQAMENFNPETLAWLEEKPQWDPRVRLAPPAQRSDVIHELAMQRSERYAGHPAADVDGTLIGDDEYDGLASRVSQVNGNCLCGQAKALDLAMVRLAPELLMALADEEDKEAKEDDEKEDGDTDDTIMLDGVPEEYIGPLLREVVMHEVGHTLGLRHNFKASTVRSLKEINTPDFKGRAQSASVMDYLPANINFENGEVQGDYSTPTIGEYDYWAIAYGYGPDKELKSILAKSTDPLHPYATDEDTWGPDPEARRFDNGADPLEYADTQVRLVTHLREKIISDIVKDGDSWAKARRAYEIMLNRHFGAVAIAANWIGGSHVVRDQKGDPGERDPVTPVDADRQRRALNFVIDNVFNDDAFGLNSELLAKMTVDKWWDGGGDVFSDPTWPVHDRIMGLQAAALTMVLNPTTLNRVYDNEFRIAPDDDAITVPEVMFTVSDAIWSELDKNDQGTFSARKPMISSLRRNLQSEHLSRLIDFTMPNARFGAAEKPVANLSVFKLRELSEKIDKTLERGDKLDPYTTAHLSEAKTRIDQALDAQYIYNANDIGGGSGLSILFMEPSPEQPRR